MCVCALFCCRDWHNGSLLSRQKPAADMSSAVFTEDSSHVLAAGKGGIKVRHSLDVFEQTWPHPSPPSLSPTAAGECRQNTHRCQTCTAGCILLARLKRRCGGCLTLLLPLCWLYSAAGLVTQLECSTGWPQQQVLWWRGWDGLWRRGFVMWQPRRHCSAGQSQAAAQQQLCGPVSGAMPAWAASGQQWLVCAHRQGQPAAAALHWQACGQVDQPPGVTCCSRGPGPGCQPLLH